MANIIKTKNLKRTGKISNSIQAAILNLINENNIDHQWYIREKGFPPTYKGLVDTVYNCSLQKLLLATGVAMTNVNSPELPESWYAILKHLNTFSNKKKELFAKINFEDLDFHKKTIYSDELGMGAAVCVLGDKYNIKFIADANDFIFNKNLYLKSGPLSKNSPFHNKKLRSIYKKLQPDFFCIGSDGKVVIAEAKGSFGVESNLKQALLRGSEQVKSVKPVGATLRTEGGRLVVATHIPIEGINKKSKPQSIVLDPEENIFIDIEVGEEDIIKFSLAKSFSFMGLSEISFSIINNKPIENFFNKEIREVRVGDFSCTVVKRIDKINSFVMDSRLFMSLKDYNLQLQKHIDSLEESLILIQNESDRKVVQRLVENNLFKYLYEILEMLITSKEENKEIVGVLSMAKNDLSHIKGAYEIINRSLTELKEFKDNIIGIHMFLELTSSKPSLVNILNNNNYFDRQFKENKNICMLPLGIGLLREDNLNIV